MSRTTLSRLLRSALLTASLASCRDDPLSTPRIVNPPETNASVAEGPSSSNPARGLVHFDELSDAELWKQIALAGAYAEVGLKLPGLKHGMAKGRVLLSRMERDDARSQVAQLHDVTIAKTDTLLPIVRVQLKSLAGLRALRRHPNVSYVEPGSFVDRSRETMWMSLESGCSLGGYGGPTGNSTISPGDVLPWNYMAMNLPAAWTRAGGGAGATVGIVDTGLDLFQPELNADFATGMSTGRTFTKNATSYAQGPYIWQDNCGHGTRMASVIGSPRNGKAILGVAWAANLHTVRVDDDVYLTNVAATREGIRDAAQHAKIIAMAFGTIGYYQSIADELSYWYALDKLFLAAAGTSTCWDPFRGAVTFPGTETTVTTVTALDKSGALACNAHYGPAVDFAGYADQPVSGLGIIGNQLAGFGGSSNGVGVVAGIAALVLSLHPNYTRDDILSMLAYAASPTGYRSNTTGWGAPNALCAVGGLCFVGITGTDLIQTYGTKKYTWSVFQAAAPPSNVTYQWSTGETTQSISRTITVSAGMQEYTLPLSVTVRDNSDGSIRTITKNVLVRDPYNCPTCW